MAGNDDSKFEELKQILKDVERRLLETVSGLSAPEDAVHCNNVKCRWYMANLCCRVRLHHDENGKCMDMEADG